MKKSFPPTLMTTVLFFTTLLFSCKKETSSSNLSPQKEQEVAILSSTSETETEVVFNDVFDNVLGVNTEVGMGGTGVFGKTAHEGTVSNRETGIDSMSTCISISIIRLSTTEAFPVTIIMDFGGGCRGQDGHIRFGKIITTYTGRLTEAGKSATASFEGFKFDSIAVEGSYTLTNTTSTGTSQRQFTIEVKEARLSKPLGAYSQWSSRRIITQTEGNGSPDYPLDDLFSITGSAHGTMKQGIELYAWHSEITQALIKKFSCRWISQGVFKVWRETLSSTSPWAAIIDYGDATCDFMATVTINKLSKAILLSH